MHEANVKDRDGAPRVQASIRSLYPWLRHVFADGGYAGDKLRAALKGKGSWTLEIIKRSDRAKDFEILPRRWVVERTFSPAQAVVARLAKDCEAWITSAVAWGLASPTSERSPDVSQEIDQSSNHFESKLFKVETKVREPPGSASQEAPLLTAGGVPRRAEHAMVQFAVIHSRNIRVNVRRPLIFMRTLKRCDLLMRGLAEHAMIQLAMIRSVDVRVSPPGLRSKSEQAGNGHNAANDRVSRHMFSLHYGSRPVTKRDGVLCFNHGLQRKTQGNPSASRSGQDVCQIATGECRAIKHISLCTFSAT